tara:strand:+ start:395 stop:652 length:258 start_codon:yes stop_codon:yes gene_type:complete
VDLTGVISSSIIPTFSKISIFALLTGFSFFLVIPLTLDQKLLIDLILSLIFRINNLLLFLTKDVILLNTDYLFIHSFCHLCEFFI